MEEEKRLPHRVQLKRTKGYRIETNTVICDRRGIYGNPYKIEQYKDIVGQARYRVSSNYYEVRPCLPIIEENIVTRLDAIIASVTAFNSDIKSMKPEMRREWLKPLLGKNLACWCSGLCHTDILFEWLKVEFGQEYEVNE